MYNRELGLSYGNSTEKKKKQEKRKKGNSTDVKFGSQSFFSLRRERYGGKTTLHQLYYLSFCTESTSLSIFI